MLLIGSAQSPARGVFDCAAQRLQAALTSSHRCGQDCVQIPGRQPTGAGCLLTFRLSPGAGENPARPGKQWPCGISSSLATGLDMTTKDGRHGARVPVGCRPGGEMCLAQATQHQAAPRVGGHAAAGHPHRSDEAAAQRERAGQARERHPVLAGGRHGECVEEQREDEQVVDAECLLDEVGGEVLLAGIRALPQGDDEQEAGPGAHAALTCVARDIRGRCQPATRSMASGQQITPLAVAQAQAGTLVIGCDGGGGMCSGGSAGGSRSPRYRLRRSATERAQADRQ